MVNGNRWIEVNSAKIEYCTYIVDCRQRHNRPNRLEVRHRLYNKSSLDAKSLLGKIWVPLRPIHQVTLDFCIFDKIPLFRDFWVGQWRGRHLEQCHFWPLQMTGSNFGLVDWYVDNGSRKDPVWEAERNHAKCQYNVDILITFTSIFFCPVKLCQVQGYLKKG